MEALSHNERKRYQLYERAGLVLTVTRFVLALVTRAVGWDWVFDSVFLLTSIALVWGNFRPDPASPEAEAALRPRSIPIALCLYLLLDSALVCAALLPTFGLPFLLEAAVGLLRLRERGASVRDLPWRSLLARPGLFVTAGALLPLFCLYLPCCCTATASTPGRDRC